MNIKVYGMIAGGVAFLALASSTVVLYYKNSEKAARIDTLNVQLEVTVTANEGLLRANAAMVDLAASNSAAVAARNQMVLEQQNDSVGLRQELARLNEGDECSKRDYHSDKLKWLSEDPNRDPSQVRETPPAGSPAT